MTDARDMTPQAKIEIRGLDKAFGAKVVLDGLDLDVNEGRSLVVIGGSGTGKSVLIKCILGLLFADGGSIRVDGDEVTGLQGAALDQVRLKFGMLFQNAALFDSLTVLDNVAFGLVAGKGMPQAEAKDIALDKLAQVELGPEVATLYPAELSGGMRKRAGLARALALDAEILFLDEPTAGLDPIGAANFDRLTVDLKQSLGLTVVMITHDLDSLYTICDRVSVLVDKRVKVGTIEQLTKEPDPWIKEYFSGPRGRAALASTQRTAGDSGGADPART